VSPLTTALDDRDRVILEARRLQFDARPGPRSGDFVRFADGVERRASHIWAAEDWAEWGGVQTSDGGSWYLGPGYCSFSGSLYSIVPFASLTLTTETKLGRVWFFHHDYHTAHNGVDAELPFRVFTCDREAPR
jgi:hypothetical protein